jgi:hypothetical protein
MTSSQPGETKVLPNKSEIPPLELQNSKSEYPKAAVGTTKGKSASVSRTVNHLDLPRAINQANGTPASKSSAETIKPMMKELAMAPKAASIRAGSLKMFWMLPVLVNMPIIGGTKIIPIKTAIAER